MKKLIPILLIASGFLAAVVRIPGPGGRLSVETSTITQTPGGKCEAQNTNTCTLSVNTTSGALLVAAISSDLDYTGAVVSCTASDTTAMTYIGGSVGGLSTLRNDLFYLQNANSGITGATCVLPDDPETATEIFIQWFSGAATSGALLDWCAQSNSTTPCNSTGAATPLNVSVDNAMVFDLGAYGGGVEDQCASFTSINVTINNAVHSVGNIIITPVNAAYTPSGCGSTSVNSSHILAAFK